jgi:hypothetical protein
LLVSEAGQTNRKVYKILPTYKQLLRRSVGYLFGLEPRAFRIGDEVISISINHMI